jgi:hypothetical protein
MSGLDGWLNQATRHLSSDSAAQVRTEIREHYESALETAVAGGATAREADSCAVAALGDAKTANRQYRKVLLTSSEARMLRNAKRESRAVCSRPWLKWSFRAMPIAALLAAVALFRAAEISQACAVVLIGLLSASPFLPVYTPARGRVFRCVKWAAIIGIYGLAFGPNTLHWSWLLFSCLWPIFWIEWTRASIRRKLPIEKWPRALYL